VFILLGCEQAGGTLDSLQQRAHGMAGSVKLISGATVPAETWRQLHDLRNWPKQTPDGRGLETELRMQFTNERPFDSLNSQFVKQINFIKPVKLGLRWPETPAQRKSWVGRGVVHSIRIPVGSFSKTGKAEFSADSFEMCKFWSFEIAIKMRSRSGKPK
jgi:hypothetical protein